MNKYKSSFPHQRNININKKRCSMEKLYTKINIEAMNNAMKDLRPNAYKLWCYFAENQNHYSFWLSAVDVHNTTGMSESSYHRAFDELVDKFYLIRDDQIEVIMTSMKCRMMWENVILK